MVKHTVFRNQCLFCLHCGGKEELKLPIGIDEMNKKIKEFNSVHGKCEKTWTEPNANMDDSVHERALWWIANGEVGMSSKTMWNCFMGSKKYPINYPSDPDDFKRCYKLLQAIPEWKDELHKLKPLSPKWSNLVDNWDTLTEMYERNVREDWKNYKEIGMYELMEKLIK